MIDVPARRESAFGALLSLFMCGVAFAVAAGPAQAESAGDTATKRVAERPWLDAKLPVEERIDLLLKAMTLEEKVGQMWQTNGIGGEPTGGADSLVAGSELYDLVRKGELGSLMNQTSLKLNNEFQRIAVEESRLGIPLIIGRDVIHGFRTIFPIPLGQAASWSPELVEEANAIAAREARSQGIHWTFAPMMDVARDPRWGRIAEGYGEDPYLATKLAVAAVKGFQGDDLTAPDRVAACAKHFVAYGAAEGGRDYNVADIAPSQLFNTYLPPFKAAVDAGVATIMCSFNDVNGVPMSGNSHILRDILRERWGFKGFVVGDWDSIREMIPHGYAADDREAARLAALGGVSMAMISQSYHKHLADLVREGSVPESTVDGLVREILRIKFRVGLFEKPYTEETSPSLLLAESHLEAARRLARQTVILLKNDGDLLPLDKSKIKKLAIIGPHADATLAQLGTWNVDGREKDARTMLAAFRESAGKDVEVTYVPGLTEDFDRSTDGFPAAVAAAKAADAVIVIVGERAQISGEANARAIIDLPGAQNELIHAVAGAGKPVVLIIQAGRPLTIGKQLPDAAAILYSFHAGTMAGPAIADLVWGVESPSGKLPATMPKAVGQIPLYYNHTSTGRPPRPYDFAKDNQYDDVIDNNLGYNSNYLDVSPYPLYPFGYGLSYTTFEYGNAELSTNKIRKGQTLAVRAAVTNTGKRDADEVVQLYVRDVVGSLTRPVRELKGFRRIHLKAGEKQVVEFALPADQLAYFNNDEELILEPGKFEVFVGGNSLAPLVGEFELVE